MGAPTDGPGPGAYYAMPESKGGVTFGMKLPIKDGYNGPGPGAYESTSTVGAAPAYSMTPRTSTFADGVSSSPGPGAYSIPSDMGKGPAKTMGAKELEPSYEGSVNLRPNPSTARPSTTGGSGQRPKPPSLPKGNARPPPKQAF